jgi:predicted alpha/beta hydrolase family esterase
MKNAIILHGMPDKEEYLAMGSPTTQHWYGWLQTQLQAQGIPTELPAMPIPYEPDYRKWTEVFEQYDIHEETILIGHSCGAGFLVRWLSENNIKVGKVILVAPWIDPDQESQNLVTDFFDFEIDPALSSRTDGITVFYSTDDSADIVKSVEILEKSVKDIHGIKFDDKGHFTLEDMGTEEFPELLKEVLK